MNRLVLSLHNFQSITEGELTFKTGLNFIIGQSNSGKSATFRALKACLLNPAGSQRFIKKGNSKSEVVLKYNGQEIQWERTSKESNYVINGEAYYKTGRSNAFKILEDKTGFNQDANGTIMNIEEELQLPFPFGLNGSELFKLFENVFCVSDSAIILKSAKDYEKGVDNDISFLNIEEQKIKVKVEELKEFKEFLDLNKLLGYRKKLESSLNRITELEDGKDIIELALKLSNANLSMPNQVFTDLIPKYQDLIKCKEILSETKRLHKLSKEVQYLNFPVTTDLSHYNALCDLKKTFDVLKKLNKLKLEEVAFENKLSRLKELIDTKEYINNFEREINNLKDNKKEEEEKLKKLELKLKEFKICPLCHKPLDNE